MTSPTILAKFRVTDQQINMVHRVEDLNKHVVFYQCESATSPGTEYVVSWNPLRHRLECSCLAGQDNQCCWHARASLAHSAEVRQERIERQAIEMAELQQDIDNESREYTVQVDPTSCSLDGVTFEDHNGTQVPMR